MASCIASIVRGRKAKDCRAVKTANDRRVYARLETEIEAIRDKGGDVEVPPEW